MSWKCRLLQIRRLPSGTPVSYGRTFVTKRATTMGVLPVGYGHGYPFRLTNRGEVLVPGGRAPIIGRVTMDMTMVDLTDIEPKPQVGDEVILIGKLGQLAVTADDLADWAGTISYEVLTGVSKRVARMYVSGGRIVTLKTLLGVWDASDLAES
jgi:alanine racemase